MDISETFDHQIDEKKVNTLGTLRLRHHETHEIILIPTPSHDPNDPLNWSPIFKYYIAVIVSLGMFICNFLAAGPSVAIVEIAMNFFGPPGPFFNSAVAKIAYFFTTTSLLQGVGNLFWMPLILKYGRRPVYISSFVGYTVCAIWAGVAKSYTNELVARIVMGFFAGSGECLGPLTIADIFFLHQRGTMMALYTSALSCGVAGGIIIAGLITISHTWRYIYYVATALIGGLAVLIIFTLPETAYNRSLYIFSSGTTIQIDDEFKTNTTRTENVAPPADPAAPARKTYIQSLAFVNGTLSNETLIKIFLRPIGLLILPPVFWATLVSSVTVGFLVAVTSNFSLAFADTYDFLPWQAGLCFFSGIIGCILGIFAAGTLSDWIADVLTRRNNGIREPEMRLPAMMVSLIASPLACVLYGVGIQEKLHWMVPTVGLGLFNFAVVQAMNVAIVYTVDAYRPIGGEVVVTQLAFKACFGFLLSFYTNPWIVRSGYAGAFGAMAGISAGVLSMWIPLYFWGKRLRHASLQWKVLSWVQWDLDREVGE